MIIKSRQPRLECNRCPMVAPYLGESAQMRKQAAANGWTRTRASMTRDNDRSGPWLDLCPRCSM
jgi:hypothetical protein